MLEGVITVIFGILFYVSYPCVLLHCSMEPALLLACCSPYGEMSHGCGCMLPGESNLCVLGSNVRHCIFTCLL